MYGARVYGARVNPVYGGILFNRERNGKIKQPSRRAAVTHPPRDPCIFRPKVCTYWKIIAYFSLPIAPGTRHFISCFSEFDCPGYHEEVGPCSICPLYWLILLTVMLASSILARMHGNHFSFAMWTTTLARLFHTLSTYLSLVAGRLDCLRLRLWMMLLFQ